MTRVGLIHTLPALAPLFAGWAPASLELWHTVDEPLLERIRRRGHIADEDIARLAAHVQVTFEIGAQAALVTCSTLSGCVDRLPERLRPRVLKIDEAMLGEAVRRPGHIVVVATNPATLEPTRQSLLDAARAAGRALDPEVRLVDEAFDAYRSADLALHDRLVIAALNELEPAADTLVLAQASMARVLDQLPAERRAKVLSSPHLALARLAALAGAPPVL